MNALIQFRKKHGLTQEQMAPLLGISQEMVSKLERGDCAPSGKVALAYEHVTSGAVKLKDFPALQKKRSAA